jgi:hypothetical protein
MKNNIDEYYFTSKNNYEYTLYFIQRNIHEYEIYFDLKNSEFNGIKYKKTNLFKENYVFGDAYWKIITSLHRYFDPNYSDVKFYIKIFNKQFKNIYEHIIENHCVDLFHNIEIKDDYMVFTRNDVTII